MVYIKPEPVTATAKLLENGRSQAVRLPREFRFEGDRVRVRCAVRGLLVEPVFPDVSAWFAELDRLSDEAFMPEGRQQPPAPARDVFVTSNSKEFARVPGLKWEDWAVTRR